MKSIWGQFLESSKAPTIDRKTLLIVGGTSEQQMSLVRRVGESQTTDQNASDGQIRYTYIKHTDSDDNLNCLMSVYSISGEPNRSVSPLLQIFKTINPRDLLVFILIDAVKLRQRLSERANAKGDPISAVFRSLADLRDWISLLDLSADDRNRDVCSLFDTMSRAYKNDIAGEENESRCDVPFGFRGAVILTSSETLDYFDQEYNVSLTSFLIDQLQQVLRVVCLQHGLALYYSSVADDDSIHSLVRRDFALKEFGKTPSLSIPPRTENLAHLFIPDGWDTWGKIRTINEDLDLRTCSELWKQELTKPSQPEAKVHETHRTTSFTSEFQQFLAESYREQRVRLKQDMQNSDKVEASISEFHQQFSADPTQGPDSRAELFKEFFTDLIKKST